MKISIVDQKYIKTTCFSMLLGFDCFGGPWWAQLCLLRQESNFWSLFLLKHSIFVKTHVTRTFPGNQGSHNIC
jgi:hypothetical protein